MVRPLCLPQVLQDMVPPKKHLLRHQPANAQIGLMEGNTFCTTLQPRLFTMDLNVVEHKVFYTEVGPAWAGSRAHRRWGRDCREPAVAWAQGGPGRAENSPSIYDFIHSQEEPLHVLQQSSLFYILPESPREEKTQPGCERDPRTWSELREPQLDQLYVSTKHTKK